MSCSLTVASAPAEATKKQRQFALRFAYLLSDRHGQTLSDAGLAVRGAPLMLLIEEFEKRLDILGRGR